LPLALAAACSRGGGEVRGAEGAAAAPSLVRTHGSFEAATRQGKTSKVVDLAPLRADKQSLGLGLLSSLRGEVTMFDGQVFLSLPNQDGSFRTEELGAHQDGAAFMVVASVPHWQTVQLPKNTSLDELPAALEELAQGAGLDVEQPLPFMIEGGVGNLTLSVVDGSAFAGDRQVSDDALKTASRKVTRASCQGTGVGFFAKGDHPEFLAEGTAVHLHFVEQLTKLAGHVESVDLPSGTSFRLPVARAR
jgi:alpha-acetolactate decarboxylase